MLKWSWQHQRVLLVQVCEAKSGQFRRIVALPMGVQNAVVLVVAAVSAAVIGIIRITIVGGRGGRGGGRVIIGFVLGLPE